MAEIAGKIKDEMAAAKFRAATRPLCGWCGRKHYGSCLGKPLDGFPLAGWTCTANGNASGPKEVVEETLRRDAKVAGDAKDAKSGTLICEECGTAFEPERSTAKYCSDPCRKKAHRRKLAGWE